MTRITVVNEKDEVIGSAERSDDASHITRVAGIWLLDENGQILLAQRGLTKSRDPGKWTVSAAGTVEEGEEYDTNIVKETKEELGITISLADLTATDHRFIESGHPYFCQMFIAKIPSATTIVPDAREVGDTRWVSLDELRAWYADAPGDFTPSFARHFEELQRLLA